MGGTGQKMWRSVEEIADTQEFRDLLEREFPAGASELLETSRRDFVKLMGAGLALAGAATIPGCRRPDHRIMAYGREVPEHALPGRALYYATSMPIPGGGAEGLVVETHDFRPTKIEGNPLHPINQGKSSVWAQASILGMYDPDRLKHPIFQNGEGKARVGTWDDFRHWWTTRERMFERLDETRGRGLAIVVQRKTSPSREAVRDSLRRRWPEAIWAIHEASDAPSIVRGTQLAMGAPHREMLSLGAARVIVSIGRDFLNSSSGLEPRAMVHARDFAATRGVLRAADEMSRLYVAESGFSVTGSCADHRLRVAPSRLDGFLVLVAREVLAHVGGEAAGGLRRALAGLSVPEGEDLDLRFIEVAARDLVEHAGASLVVGGPALSAEAHAVIHALNRALGNVGRTVSYLRIEDADESVSGSVGVAAVAAAIDAGSVHTVICVETNPVFDAPGELGFAARFARVPRRITLGVHASETGEASTWQLNAPHFLESWGDTRAADGTIAPVQPMIAPLYEPAMSELEFLAWLSGDERFVEPDGDATPANGEAVNGRLAGGVSGHRIVRETWRSLGLIRGDFERGWRRALHDGVVQGTAARAGQGPATGEVLTAAAGAASAIRVPERPGGESLDVVFAPGNLCDGRFANVPWLHELAQPGSYVVWDNPALVSPATAERLNLMPQPYTRKEPKARVASLRIGDRTVEVPVWILPGMADDTVILTLGYGRRTCGSVGDGVGFDVYPTRDAGASTVLRGARLTRTSRRYFVASTQNHWSLEGRTAIFRQMDRKWWMKYGDKEIDPQPDEIYGRFEAHLNVAEQLGELSHTPPNIGAYPNPFNASPGDPDPSKRVVDRLGRKVPPAYSTRPQWGMSIDLSTCTGCGACTVACRSENNIPVVGKKEVAKGREMSWIRVDRYFTGDDWRNPEEMVHQPVACLQCENAPCETVCPVNATSHDEEGLNVMTYNRCIGTRYCANNCPYKARRFNFFDYGVKKFNGAFVGEKALGARPDNVNLIPPRLRQRLDEITKLRMNPDVTVRSRGVMEKCTFCIQRINAGRFEMKLKDLEHIPDGFVQTACQQACPSGSIVFGDLLDPESRVRRLRDNNRSYLLLGYLNTRPRLTHMIRVRNPHPDLTPPERMSHDPLYHAHHGGGDGERQHSFLHDPGQARDDDGYAMSLRVLNGAHA